MRAVVSLFLLAACASCKPSIRLVDICRLFPEDNAASCAKGDKKYDLAFPTQLVGYYAFHEESLNLLGARLEECEVNGRLPRGDTTWDEMNACVITMQGCGQASHDDLFDHYAVPPKSQRKILDRLNWCKTR